MVVDKDGQVLDTLSIDLAVCGTAGQTDVQVRVNGVAKATLTITNAEADGIFKVSTTPINLALAKGDVVDINVSAAPTGGTGLSATARLRPVTVE